MFSGLDRHADADVLVQKLLDLRIDRHFDALVGHQFFFDGIDDVGAEFTSQLFVAHTSSLLSLSV